MPTYDLPQFVRIQLRTTSFNKIYGDFALKTLTLHRHKKNII